ncbi:hypothetical protein FKW77_006400 [Venturia effusa]|uniref:Arabinogalactan endo-beta-1,4-galactanase n=1 Tax=Venturia effusa TaxID=50376 RepID=A0A517LFM9_9PEZI|nr:hypothetical protein FKW77_006400 [Venturia effusa]
MKLLPSFFAWSHFSFQASTSLIWKTHDISSLLLEEQAGVKYRDLNGTTAPLETIIKNNGANSVKIRIWVAPPTGEYNLDYALKLAKRVKAAGLGIILNLHYSDSWADPAKQSKPAAWRNLSTTALIAKVATYTTSVLDAFSHHGIHVQLITIGNEIRAGFLWPTGQWDQFPTMVKLIEAGIEGVADSKIVPKPKIMLHLDRGYSWGTQEWFYDNLIANGFDMSTFDIQGLSCYPFWDVVESTFENFEKNLNNMAAKYKKGIVCSETDWPIQCTNASENIPYSLYGTIPFTPAGQVMWMQKLAAIVKALPGKLGKGVMYWEGGWVNNPSLGSACESSVLFSREQHWNATVAKALPSINMFKAI